jgi:ketosteroid isomerase-like protein
MSVYSDPNELGAALVAAINQADLDALVDLYEESALLELPDGSIASGHDEIREFYAGLLKGRPRVTPGRALPALIQGDMALTTTQIGDSATAEVARRQADAGWRWVLDRPNVMIST